MKTGAVVASLLGIALAACARPPERPEPAPPPRILGPPPPGYVQSAPLLSGLGDRTHPISTHVELAQRYFDQGLVLAFGFNHAEAARSFREVQQLDPDAIMGYWGEALVLGPNINDTVMDAERVRGAWSALQQAQARLAGASPAEAAYVRALAARYAPEPDAERAPLDRAYADAMRELARSQPDDLDAQALFAEALMDTTPWDYWLPGKQPKPVTREILATLEGVLARDPSHPLANHLTIHAVEAAYPERGVEAAERLPAAAPGAGHLVHMPAHIWIRVGRYADAADANERAIAADDAYLTQCHAQGLYPIGYVPHNHHFLWFAASMQGRGARAIEAAQEVSRRVDPDKLREPGYGTLQHYYVLPLYAMTRFGRWTDILAQPKPAPDLRYPVGVWRYARGMALTRMGRIEAANLELGALRRLAADPALDAVTIWEINSTRALLGIAEEVLAGEIALRKGDPDAAIAHLREAVAREDALAYDEPPPWHAPVRQTLGAALLAADRGAEAEQVYLEDLAKYPDNGWSLFGLTAALRQQGRAEEAEATRRAFETAWSQADVTLESSRL
jgi:tetratricopeptide (TPR) repeat protein